MNMRQRRLSVAMCTCNGARFLREQLESLAAQTLLPTELVVCDDCSTDASLGILQSFCREAPFTVRLIANQDRLGPTRNFEKAIRLCLGEIILLADQDDVWAPNKVAVLAGSLEQAPGAAYAFSNGETIDPRGDSLETGLWEMQGFSSQQLQALFPAGQVELLLRKNIVTGCTMAFRADLRSLFLPIPESWIHDYWIALLGSLFAYGVPISDRLIRYRKHATQQVGVTRRSLRSRAGESLRARTDDYWGRLRVARDLQERVRFLAQTLSCPVEYLAQIDQKTTHLAVRAASQEASGLRKVRMVLGEWLSGGYGRFSGSWRSVVRDLCPRFLLD
ncbi:MAG: glycosyltransferase family 2 protein [Candidatus Acidiferrales bacterium]